MDMKKEGNNVELNEVMDIDGIEFKTTNEGIKLLDKLIAGHNELNHKKKDVELNESFEIGLPKEVLKVLKVKVGDQIDYVRHVKGVVIFKHDEDLV